MPKRAFDAVIFDIDNVLIDTRGSYLDAIRWTVEIYLTHGNVPFFRSDSKSREPKILSLANVHEFKLLGGFNDDWDCCYGLLIYLLNLPVKARTVKELKKSIDLKAFGKEIKRRPLRVSGITKKLGRPGDVTIEKISRIFQEVYLGRDLFETAERCRAMYWKKRGLLHKEKLIFKRVTLRKLKKMGIKLAIATGRPRFEAIYALKHFEVLDYFDTLITMDEIKAAEVEMKQSLRKPHPYSVLEAARQLGTDLRLLYIGDLPDDILATRDAKADCNIKSVGFPWYGSRPKETLEEMGKLDVDFALRKPTEIADLVKKGKL